MNLLSADETLPWLPVCKYNVSDMVFVAPGYKENAFCWVHVSPSQAKPLGRVCTSFDSCSSLPPGQCHVNREATQLLLFFLEAKKLLFLFFAFRRQRSLPSEMKE